MVRLAEYLRTQHVGHVITSPSDVELEPEFITQPDIPVVPMAEWQRVAAEGFPIHELLLAVEVLSPSSSRHDRVRKRPHYQRHVPDYWIVDLDARLIERWAPADERPELLIETLAWHPVGATTPFVMDIPPVLRVDLRNVTGCGLNSSAASNPNELPGSLRERRVAG